MKRLFSLSVVLLCCRNYAGEKPRSGSFSAPTTTTSSPVAQRKNIGTVAHDSSISPQTSPGTPRRNHAPASPSSLLKELTGGMYNLSQAGLALSPQPISFAHALLLEGAKKIAAKQQGEALVLETHETEL